MKGYAVVTLLLSFYTITSNAQNISGKIIDAKTTEELPFANVFLNNTTNGTVSDVNGNFVLKNIEPGTYDLVISFMGYEPRKIKINVRNAFLFLSTIAVVPSKVVLNNVDVKGTRDKAWERQLKKFSSIFLGKNKLATSCKILNPWVIDFPKDTTGSNFIATANAPIEILNEALGYKVFYYLSEFWWQELSRGYMINGNIRFEELDATNEKQILNWKSNREEAYLKSYNYFFNSILRNNCSGVGYKIYIRRKNKGEKRREYENWTPFDTTGIISNGERAGEFEIAMKGEFEIYDTRYHDKNGLEIKGDYVSVNDQGFVLNPTDLKVSGSYGENRVASLLPISYRYQNAPALTAKPEQSTLDWLYEKIYIHTDKPYYYPGEPLWFKGYVNYATPAWRDSLSRTVYVELINPQKNITLTKTLRIDSGFFHNDFILPDTLKEGTYYLRAYTNLSRNFGDSSLFVKPIAILNITNRIDPSQEKQGEIADSLLQVTSDKTTYKTREKINLTLMTKDNEKIFVPSNLSISVTDEFQVASIDPTITIKEGLSLEKLKILKPISLTYTNESGVSIAGQFINNKSNGEKAVLNVMQIEQQRLTQIETDETGIFMLNDLQFYDSTTFSFKPIREKDVAYGNVKIRNRETPPMFFKDQSLNLNIIKTMLPQRTLSEYEMPRDARLLEAVVVKGKKIEQIKPYSQGPWSGRIIKGKDLNQTNLLFSLKNTPGVKVDMVSGEVRSSRGGMMTGAAIAAGLGQGNDGGSLYSLSIDGIPIQGPGPGYIGETLAALDPANIEFMYVGRTHIAVYMKRAEDINTTPAFQLLKIQGYSPPRSFRHPDYSNPKTDTTKADYRSTIYWNPNVITDSKNGTATVSFFAADLPGKYRIVAEGVTQNGEPVRCVYFIEVISN